MARESEGNFLSQLAEIFISFFILLPIDAIFAKDIGEVTQRGASSRKRMMRNNS